MIYVFGSILLFVFMIAMPFLVGYKELKEKIYNEACEQQPITGCSHLLVFASYTQITEKYLDDYFDLINKKRNPSKEWCDKYRKKIEFFLQKKEKLLHITRLAMHL